MALTSGDNRIALSSRDIKNYLGRIRDLKTPPELRTNRRLLSRTPSTDKVKISKNEVKPMELKLHPEAPSVDMFVASVEQRAGNLSTLFALFPQGKELIKAAIQEQKLLGAPV